MTDSDWGIDDIPDAVIRLDGHGVIRAVNAAAGRLTHGRVRLARHAG